MKHTILVTVIGLLFPMLTHAQSNKTSQDSITFHQSFITNNSLDNIATPSLRSTATSNAGSFTVAGDQNTYYPVAFADNGWNHNEVTVLEIGRSSTHGNSQWNGSLMSTFKFHVTRWGHGSGFVDADIKQHTPSTKNFIGGWQDITGANSSVYLIIWLRGAASYYYHSNYPQTPLFTSGSLTIEGISCAPKTQIEDYVNTNGLSLSKSIWATGTQSNYFKGNVGIGTSKPDQKLTVKGKIHAEEVIIDMNVLADYVFKPEYKLMPLKEVEEFVKTNNHLPEIPSASQVEKEGMSLGEMQNKLLQKIEELTLYVIQQEKRLQEQENNNSDQKKMIEKLKEQLNIKP